MKRKSGVRTHCFVRQQRKIDKRGKAEKGSARPNKILATATRTITKAKKRRRESFEARGFVTIRHGLIIIDFAIQETTREPAKQEWFVVPIIIYDAIFFCLTANAISS